MYRFAFSGCINDGLHLGQLAQHVLDLAAGAADLLAGLVDAPLHQEVGQEAVEEEVGEARRYLPAFKSSPYFENRKFWNSMPALPSALP